MWNTLSSLETVPLIYKPKFRQLKLCRTLQRTIANKVHANVILIVKGNSSFPRPLSLSLNIKIQNENFYLSRSTIHRRSLLSTANFHALCSRLVPSKNLYILVPCVEIKKVFYSQTWKLSRPNTIPSLYISFVY